MRYGATHRGFESRPLRHLLRPARSVSRHPRYHLWAVLGGELAVPCTCNPLQQGRIPSRGRRSRRLSERPALRTGSRAAATREPRQVRKEAAISAARRVPRTGLVRADRFGKRGSASVDGGCTAFGPVHGAPAPVRGRASRAVGRDLPWLLRFRMMTARGRWSRRAFVRTRPAGWLRAPA